MPLSRAKILKYRAKLCIIRAVNFVSLNIVISNCLVFSIVFFSKLKKQFRRFSAPFQAVFVGFN